MDKLVILGCGYLANVVVDAYVKGLLPGYELVGVCSRTKSKAERLVNALSDHGYSCEACATVDELLALKPAYVVEMASPAAVRECAVTVLSQGASLVPLSIGAFADDSFYDEVVRTAQAHGGRVYIPSGATGGFDVLRAATLMGNTAARFFNEKGPHALRGTPVYDSSLMSEARQVFAGNARQAIAMFPTRVNVSVAASLASVGVDAMQMSMLSTPGFVGDTQRVEVRNDQVRAVVDVYSRTPEIAAWSVVSTLINIHSPFVF